MLETILKTNFTIFNVCGKGCQFTYIWEEFSVSGAKIGRNCTFGVSHFETGAKPIMENAIYAAVLLSVFHFFHVTLSLLFLLVLFV